MRLHVAIAAYNEQALIGDAIRSLTPVQADAIHVFDGAWRGGRNGRHVFMDGGALSTDETVTEAVNAANAIDVPIHFYAPPPPVELGDPWPSQEAKRTAMFANIGAREGDYVLVFDCDERIEHADDDLREWLVEVAPPTAANVSIRCVGGNDMPGIRDDWPRGDYSETFKPEVRLFRWHPTLECVYPGGYMIEDRMIRVYADNDGTSALPVAPVWIDHHGNLRDDDRKAAKIAYYAEEHPERLRWQRAMLATERR